MSTEHPANYLTIFNGDGDAVQATLDQVLETMKEQLGGENPSTLTVSSGSITPTSGAHAVDAETGSSDDLSNVVTTNLMEGQLLLLWPAEGSEVTVNHQAGGAGQITLRDGADVTLNAPDKYVLLQRLEDDWQEAGHLGNIVDPADMMRLEAVREGVQLSRENDVLDLNKGAVKIHEEAGGADLTASGTIVTMNAGSEALVFGDICYVDNNGLLKKANADAVATTTSVVMALAGIAATESGSFLVRGFVRDESWSWTVGGVVYASDTAGGLTQAPGSGAVVGIATHATRMHFTPDKTLTTRQLWVDENAGGADLTASGAITSLTAGDDLSFGDLCYVDVNGQMQKVDASSADANPVEAMALATITNGNSGTFLIRGFVRDDSWSLTPGGVMYATGATGGMSQSDASGPVVGVATASNLMHFTPDKTLSSRQVRLNEEAGGADHTASGTTVTLTAGEDLLFGDVCYLDPITEKYMKADKVAVATFPGIVMALEDIALNASGMFLLRGFVRDDSWSWDIGDVIYGSPTSGSLSDAESLGAVLGVATGSKYIHFTPDKAVVSQQLAMELDEEAGGANHTASGITVDMTAGENLDEDDQPVDLVFGDVCYVDEYGKLTKGTAHIATDTPVRAMALETIAEDESGKVLLTGFVWDDSWDWTTGGLVYLSADAGQLTQTKPTGTGEMIQAVGVATNADRIFFDPNSCFTRNDGELRGVFFYPYEVGKSCLFVSGDSTYMAHTPSAAATQQIMTMEFIIKRATLGTEQMFFTVTSGSSSYITFTAANTFGISARGTGGLANKTTTQLCRDTSQFYHFVVRFNSTEDEPTDMVKVWINGVEVTDWSTDTCTVSQGGDWDYMGPYAHNLGRLTSGSLYADMYLSRFAVCNGQEYNGSDFGEEVNGIWCPKDISGLTFGDYGFYLDFSDPSFATYGLGKDVSGNDKHWTPSGITSANQSTDTPTNNFCTMNPLNSGKPLGLTEGNLQFTSTTGSHNALNESTFRPLSGKWYWEVKSVYGPNNGYPQLGILDGYFDLMNKNASLASVAGNDSHYVFPNSADSQKLYKYSNGSTTKVSDTIIAANDIYGFTLDVDAGELKVYVNGSLEGTVVTGLTGPFMIAFNDFNTTADDLVNFGSPPPSFTGTSESDGNGYGNFEYEPPSGFMSLCSANMPEPTVGECVGDPCVKAIAYTGTGASLPITGIGFQPDLVIIVGNEAGYECAWYTSTRGAGKYIDTYYLNTHIAEVTDAQSLTSFDADGFTLGTSTASNANGSDYVAYCFKKGADYGVDIVEFTGTGAATTVAHSLGVPPSAMFVKNLAGQEIVVYHAESAADAETDYSLLDLATAFTDDATMWNDTAPDASNITVGTNNSTNKSGDTHIAILFASVEGVSNMSSFDGNAAVDGPFVNCGFRPEIFWQLAVAGGSAYLCATDQVIDPENPTGAVRVYVNSGFAGTSFPRDLVSNGYKLRTNNATYNGVKKYVTFAWAKQPFKYANAR